jgi:hypothetical protein
MKIKVTPTSLQEFSRIALFWKNVISNSCRYFQYFDSTLKSGSVSTLEKEKNQGRSKSWNFLKQIYVYRSTCNFVYSFAYNYGFLLLNISFNSP